MRNKLQHSWRSPIIFVLIVTMMAALFFSRAVLSLAMIAFVVVLFCHAQPRKHFANFFSSPLLWGMSLLFFIPLLSGLWSEDKKEWADMLRIKLPLLFLPLAFAGPIRLLKKQWDWLGIIFIGLVMAGSCWTMYHYLANAAAVNESYLRAKTITTPLENDHVRFSWLVSISILLAGWLAFSKRKESRVISFSLTLGAVLLIVFLHILAVRTGLFSFYIMVGGTAVYIAFKKNNPLLIGRKYAVLLIVALIALPWIAYKTIPTFKNRVEYFMYDSGYFTKAHYLRGATDAIRVISIKAGWSIMQDHPVTGVGFGDVLPRAKKWYSENYPGMVEGDKIYPGSEWLMYGSACGWPGFLLFGFVMFIPFFIRTRHPLLWWLLNVTAAFSFLFDIGLEVQFGVFIYSFVILWWHQWLNAEKM